LPSFHLGVLTGAVNTHLRQVVKNACSGDMAKHYIAGGKDDTNCGCVAHSWVLRDTAPCCCDTTSCRRQLHSLSLTHPANAHRYGRSKPNCSPGFFGVERWKANTCCPGFFCPDGLVCMLPCMNGSFCPWPSMTPRPDTVASASPAAGDRLTLSTLSLSLSLHFGLPLSCAF
jgi:hypothetical protein